MDFLNYRGSVIDWSVVGNGFDNLLVRTPAKMQQHVVFKISWFTETTATNMAPEWP